MRFILVVDRRHLFPGLSPQGLLAADAVDSRAVEHHGFFAEREFMEQCSHYKQLIPYIALLHEDHVLCYQRQAKHSEQRLGGLWTVGFGGHIEPIDREGAEVHEYGLLRVAALRELEEETGIAAKPSQLTHRGFINSEADDVSTVHFGMLFSVDLAGHSQNREALAAQVEAQAEPYRVAWRPVAELATADGIGEAPDGGQWENWTRLALPGLTSDS